MRKLGQKAAGGLGLTCALLACTTPNHTMPEPLVLQNSRYVAMGSSFAAGAGIGPTKAKTPERCSRTTNNYASLLANRLRLTLDDQSCGGATTSHITTAWGELAPQIEAVDADTRLVTLTIGGNDINYVGNLFMASCAAGTALERDGQRMPCMPLTAPSEQSYATLEQALVDVATQVKLRAPDAVMVFVQYVSLVPASPCENAAMSAKDAEMIREMGNRLAEVTARAASATNSLLLPSDELSRDHTPCDAVPWATGLPPGYNPANGAPWHPNAAGHEAIADALADMLDRPIRTKQSI